MGIVSFLLNVFQPNWKRDTNVLGLRIFVAAGRRRNSELLTQVGQFQAMA
mgnify:CR=1 FL=1